MEYIGAPSAWDLSTGNSNFVLAVIDTGIQYDHEDIAKNMWVNPGEDLNGDGEISWDEWNGIDDDMNGYIDDFHGWDCADNDNDPYPDAVDEAHGLHCAGTIGGVGDNGIGVAGVNWRVKIVSLRFLDESGSGQTADAIEAMNYVIQNNIQLSNNSWGGPSPSLAMSEAIEKAGLLANHLFIAAAGNEGMNNDIMPSYPSSYDLNNIISVAALNPPAFPGNSSSMALFSNYGATSVDIAAPGVGILSTIPVNEYEYFDGTSMAAPHVTGVAAFLWGVNPNMAWKTIRKAILMGARTNANLDGFVLTDGELNIPGALGYLDSAIATDQRCYRSDATVTVSVMDFGVPLPTIPPSVPAVGTNNISLHVELHDAGGARKWETDITLTRVGRTARFVGTLDLSSPLVPALEGDNLVFIYTGTNNRTAEVSAPIDNTPPVISNLKVEQVDSDWARISWITDEPSRADFIISQTLPLAGVTPYRVVDGPGKVVVDGPYTSYYHSVTVDRLDMTNLYYYAIVTLDCAQNQVSNPVDLTSLDPADYPWLFTLFRENVYSYDLEDGLAGWQMSSATTGEVWQLGEPVYGPTAAYSGKNLFGTVLNGRYPNLAKDSWVESPTISVGKFPRLHIQSWHSMSIEAPPDHLDQGFVEVNDGKGWKNVTMSDTNLYGGRIWMNIPEWRKREFNLSAFEDKGVKIRFRIDSGEAGTAAGWYVDDVVLSEVKEQGLNLLGYTIDDSVGGDGDGYPDPGETFYIDIEMLNSFVDQTLTGVTATAQTSAEGVTIKSGASSLNYGDIAPATRKKSGNVLLVQASDSVLPDSPTATFFHDAVDASGTVRRDIFKIKFDNYKTVAGKVTDIVGGAPVDGAIVIAEAKDMPTRTAISEATGQYLLHGLSDGVTYKVYAYKPGVFSPSEGVELTAPQTGWDIELGVATANPSPASFTLSCPQGTLQKETLTLDNTAGTVDLIYEMDIEYDFNSAAENWLSVTNARGTVVAGATGDVTLYIDTDGPQPGGLNGGAYGATIVIKSNDVGGDDIDVPVSLKIVPSPILTLSRVEASGGDGDGVVEPGETQDIDVVLGNRGDETATFVTGVLRYVGATGLVTVVDSDMGWMTIEPGLGTHANNLGQITVAGSVTNGTPLLFELDVNTGVLNWTFPFTLVALNRQTISGTITASSGGTPVEGVTVLAEGPTTEFAVSRADGTYDINSLIDGTYMVSVNPVPSYSRPPSQNVTMSGADQTGIDFQLAQWDVESSPTSVVVNVYEGNETNVTLAIKNNGPVAGNVRIVRNLTSDVPPDLLPEPNVPVIEWNTLDVSQYDQRHLLVRFEDQATQQSAKSIMQRVNGEIIYRFRTIPAGIVRVPANTPLEQAVRTISALSGIRYAEPMPVREVNDLPNDPMFSELWGLRNKRQTGGTLDADVQVEPVWENNTVGDSDVIVAVVDSGVATYHPDLIDNIWVNTNEVKGEMGGNDAPGLLGVDDDGDAPATTIGEIPGNLMDDNDNGLVDETGIDFGDVDVMRADYDGDDLPLSGPYFMLDNPFTNPDSDNDPMDWMLATLDDNENGINDISELLLHAPGTPGVDDDNDAAETTAGEIPNNGIDDNHNGLVDETGIDFRDVDVMRADYNGNGTPLAGPNGILEDPSLNPDSDDDPLDWALACFDDDENGFWDDINGYDFGTLVVENPKKDIYSIPNPDPDPVSIPKAGYHGTHVAGTIAAVGNNDIGVCGVNWDASIMACKIAYGFVEQGVPNMILVPGANLVAMDYALAMGVKLSNHSYGGVVWSGVARELFHVAYTNYGHLSIMSAGNDGQNNDLYPKFPSGYDTPGIIAVAANDKADMLANFSNFGLLSVDISAPGVDILSTSVKIPEEQLILPPTEWVPVVNYISIGGTSMATPHVCGVAALLKAAVPDASPAMLRNAIFQGRRHNERYIGKMSQPGNVDVAGAMEWLKTFWLKADPPILNLASGASANVLLTLNYNGRLPTGTHQAEIVLSENPNRTVVPITLNVLPAPVPFIVDVAVDDQPPGGDGDGYVEPGETVKFTGRLKNEGSGILMNASGLFSSVHAGISFPDNRSTWPGIISDAEADALDPASMAVGAAVSGPVTVDMDIDNGTLPSWKRSFQVNVERRNTISGRVRDAGTGAGVGGCRVEYWGKTAGSVVTESDGFYRVDGLSDGTYRVRPVPVNNEKPAHVETVLSASDSVLNFNLRLTDVTFSTNKIEVPLLVGQDATYNWTITNNENQPFDFKITEMPERKIALISDGDQLSPISNRLVRLGFKVSVYNENVIMMPGLAPGYLKMTGRYSGDPVLLLNHDMVIMDLSDTDSGGRLLSDDERTAMIEYLEAKGKIIFTGPNPLSRPDDRVIMSLTGTASMDRLSETASQSALLNDVIPDLFVDVDSGQEIEVSEQVYDLATLNTNANAVAVYTVDSGNKVVRTETDDGGVVYLWTGNRDNADWAKDGLRFDVLKNILVDELQGDVPWLDVGVSSGAVQNGSLANMVRVDSITNKVGRYSAMLRVKGNYPGADTDFIEVVMEIKDTKLTAQALGGVTNWLGQALAGDGGAGSSVLQLLYAGANGQIDPPNAQGGPGGDDRLLRTYPAGVEVARFGAGGVDFDDRGMFSIPFSHAMRSDTPSRYVYVRAWDSESIESSVAYGESRLYEIVAVVGETHDFGAWVVNKAIGYPGFGARDTNGDSIPDGYYINKQMDPRDPIVPLPKSISQVGEFGSYGSGDGQLAYPTALVLSDKFVFVLDRNNNRIVVVDRATLTQVSTFGSVGSGNSRFASPRGMGRHPSQPLIAVADTSNHRVIVLRFNEQTGALSFERTIGQYGDDAGDLIYPYDVAFDPIGNLYVADHGHHCVKMFTSEGVHISTIGEWGDHDGEFKGPEGIEVDRNGIIYVSDTDNSRIQAFSGAGMLLWKTGSLGSGDGEFQDPVGLRMDYMDRMIVADAVNNRFQYFTPDLKFMATFGSQGVLPGEFKLPNDIAPAIGTNLLFVADTYNHRIQVLKVDLDYDADGMEDSWENRCGLNPKDDGDALIDSDGDGVFNIGEYRITTYPQNPDTDGDAMSDGDEVHRGYDPLDPEWDNLRVTRFAPGFLMSYVVESGKRYKVQSRIDLQVGDWVDEPQSEFVAPLSGVVVFTNVQTGVNHKYFRPVKINP